MSMQHQVLQQLAVYWGAGAVVGGVLLGLWFKFMTYAEYVYRYNLAGSELYQIRRWAYPVYLVLLCGMCGCLIMALYDLIQVARLG